MLSLFLSAVLVQIVVVVVAFLAGLYFLVDGNGPVVENLAPLGKSLLGLFGVEGLVG
jgi:hypothetical protein